MDKKKTLKGILITWLCSKTIKAVNPPKAYDLTTPGLFTRQVFPSVGVGLRSKQKAVGYFITLPSPPAACHSWRYRTRVSLKSQLSDEKEVNRRKWDAQLPCHLRPLNVWTTSQYQWFPQIASLRKTQFCFSLVLFAQLASLIISS